jgi:hypothetical protein
LFAALLIRQRVILPQSGRTKNLFIATEDQHGTGVFDRPVKFDRLG